MRQSITVLMVLVASHLLSGCATMSEAECNAADWGIRGEDDGREGRPAGTVNDHAKACAEYGIVPDTASYRAGWEQGITVYCTRDNGFRRGVQGDIYERSCPLETEAEFVTAYRAGKRIHDQEVVLIRLESELREVKDKLDDLDSDEAERREKLRNKRERLRNDVSSAEATLQIRRLEAQVQGYQLP